MRFDPVECGMRIRSLREGLHLTRAQFAEQINISPDHLKSLEKGKRACSIDLLAEISLAFDISLDYLILGKSPNKNSAKSELLKAIEMLDKVASKL